VLAATLAKEREAEFEDEVAFREKLIHQINTGIDSGTISRSVCARRGDG